MTKLIETLKNAGWVETTLGECRPGEEVVIVDNGHVRHEFITRADVTRGTVSDAKGFQWAAETPAQRPPRPNSSEYPPGTVALITWDGQDEPIRAMRLNQDWTTVDDRYVMEGSAKVLRVLLPADQDTPPIEITDEMVLAALRAWDVVTLRQSGLNPRDTPVPLDDWSPQFQERTRTALKAALGEEKEK